MTTDIIYTFRNQEQKQMFFSICENCEHNKNQSCEAMSQHISQIIEYNEFVCVLGKWK